jgi:hypothetical protein
MGASDLYAELAKAINRPAPFSVYTADALWTDPHTSRQMLNFHLNSKVDISSRGARFIDESVGRNPHSSPLIQTGVTRAPRH